MNSQKNAKMKGQRLLAEGGGEGVGRENMNRGCLPQASQVRSVKTAVSSSATYDRFISAMGCGGGEGQQTGMCILAGQSRGTQGF